MSDISGKGRHSIIRANTKNENAKFTLATDIKKIWKNFFIALLYHTIEKKSMPKIKIFNTLYNRLLFDRDIDIII